METTRKGKEPNYKLRRAAAIGALVLAPWGLAANMASGGELVRGVEVVVGAAEPIIEGGVNNIFGNNEYQPQTPSTDLDAGSNAGSPNNS